MRRIYRYLSNLYYLKRIADNKLKTEASSGQQISTILRIIKQYRKDRHQFIRNQATSAIKEIRKNNPFTPKDYSEAKKMYEEYCQLPNHIGESDVDSWVDDCKVYLYKFRDQAPVKSNKYGSYYINGIWGSPTVFLLKDKSKFNKEFRTAYLYATTEQIADYQERMLKIDEINKQIEVYQNHISDLNKEKRGIIERKYKYDKK